MSTAELEMRRAMGHFATGVAVVTARDASGWPLGTTVNAFSSVSLRPRLLLVCLDRESETLAAVRESGRFAVNVLAADQREHSDRFACKGRDARAHEVGFTQGRHGAPFLEDALVWIACRVDALHPAGDHEIVVGEALSIEAGGGEEPLLFFRGAYSRLAVEVELTH